MKRGGEWGRSKEWSGGGIEEERRKKGVRVRKEKRME